jgi:hypothetical protein
MTRFLLALLALIGVVAQSAPAVARVEGAQVGVVAAQAVAARAVAACIAEVSPPQRPAHVVAAAPACGPSPVLAAPRAPAVRIGIDRSAE